MAKPIEYIRSSLINDCIDAFFQEHKQWSDIRKDLLKKYKMSDDCSYQIVLDAKKQIRNEAFILFGDDIEEDIKRWEALHVDAIAAGDRRSANECLKEIGKLKGHYVERVQLKVDTGPLEIKFGTKKDGDSKEKDD